MKHYYNVTSCRWNKGYSLLPLLLVLFSSALFSQKTITGVVTDEDNEPLIGVNIAVEGSTLGTITDIDGSYSLSDVNEGDVLSASYIGYNTMMKTVGAGTVIDFALAQGVALEEVTVTALGIKRETKALGYAAQKVDGKDLSVAKSPNLLDNLTGKVAGVNVTQGGSGVGSSSRIVIRGESSLSGDNQPLFVVNGVPINNSHGGTGRGSGNQETDYGNGAGEISPDDIESMTILRGANATALYGSRAANGVVLITTKSGEGKKGIGVSFNSATTFENILRLPKYQNKYGQGSKFAFEFVNGSGKGTADGVDESWGPKFDGTPRVMHHSTNAKGIRAGDLTSRPSDFSDQSTFKKIPWSSQPDNIRSFFETGINTSNNIAITGANETTNFRLSYTNQYSKGILPNTDLKRNNVNLSVGHDILDKTIELDANINYINSGSKNRPNNSYGTENIMYLWIWFGRHIPMASLRDYWQKGREGIQQFNYNYNWHDNPYFTMYENTNAFDKNRVFGNVSAKWNITDKLSFMLRSGMDFSNDLRTTKRAWSTQRYRKGQYKEDRVIFKEENSDFLFSYNDYLSEDLSFSASFGGNRMTQNSKYLQLAANQLSAPGVYSFKSSAIPVATRPFYSKRRINSLYANASFGYKNAIYLDLAGRNDWSSTLPAKNNSYFYPSASVSFIASELFDLPRSVSFAKLRVGYGQVGNDTDPYSLLPYFVKQGTYNGKPLGTEQDVLPNPDLKPERVTTFEIGTDLRLFDNRLGLDLTYYNNVATDQIIRIPITWTSGYSRRTINAGKINSQGIEALVSVVPVRTKDFEWETSFNFTRSRSKVIKLTDKLKTYQISGNYVSVVAKEGGRMGDVYGTGFKLYDPVAKKVVQVDDVKDIKEGWGHIYKPNGTPERDSRLRKLGNYNPDFNVGFYNSLKYKNWNLGFLFDWKQGGVIHSRTLMVGNTAGLMAESAEYDRETTKYIGGTTKVKGNKVLSRPGYKKAADGTYVKNDTEVTANTFYSSHFSRSNEEVGMYDASFVKLREVKIGYSFDKSIASKIGAQRLSLSLVGRNLLLFTENPHFDPETFSFSGNRVVPGVEDMATPSTRSFGINLGVTF